MILSTMGNASSSSFTIENSCSGPMTSNVLYVKVQLLLKLFFTIEYKASSNENRLPNLQTLIGARASLMCNVRSAAFGKMIAEEQFQILQDREQ